MKLIIGNKSDEEANRKVSIEEARALADSLGITFKKTSAKSSVNVERPSLL